MYAADLAANPKVLNTDTPASPVPAVEYVNLLHLGFASCGSERFRVLRRQDAAPWSAVRLEADRLSANFQGNPLWPEQAIRRYPELSEHFALGLSSPSTCWIPDQETVNAALKQLLGDQAYQFVGRKEMSDPQYVDLFIDERCLPMAPVEERDSVHDWSYHFVTFLFQEYLENVRLTLKWIRANMARFEGQVSREWNYYGHTHDEHGRMKGTAKLEVMPYTQAIYRQMAISLDVATAKIVQLLCLREKGMAARLAGELEFIRKFFGGVTAEGAQTILWLEKNLNLPSPTVGTGYRIECAPIKYLDTTLQALERKAQIHNSPCVRESRQKAFAEFLRNR